MRGALADEQLDVGVVAHRHAHLRQRGAHQGDKDGRAHLRHCNANNGLLGRRTATTTTAATAATSAAATASTAAALAAALAAAAAKRVAEAEEELGGGAGASLGRRRLQRTTVARCEELSLTEDLRRHRTRPRPRARARAHRAAAAAAAAAAHRWLLEAGHASSWPQLELELTRRRTTAAARAQHVQRRRLIVGTKQQRRHATPLGASGAVGGGRVVGCER